MLQNTLGLVSHLLLVHPSESCSTLVICLTAHHLVDALLAIALSFLTYFCIYGRTTEQLLQRGEASAGPCDDEVFESCGQNFYIVQ